MVTFSRLLNCERGRGENLSERRSISVQQVAEPQVMTRRVGAQIWVSLLFDRRIWKQYWTLKFQCR